MDDLRPAVEIANEDEARAMRLAVRYALEQGLASDDEDGRASNRSLVSLGRKLGVQIPDWCDKPEESHAGH